MSGYVSVDIWIDDTDIYNHVIDRTGNTAIVSRPEDFSICSKSPDALRELSDHLQMAANELAQQQRRRNDG